MTQLQDDDFLDGVDTEERGINAQTIERVIRLATEIAREGREGRKIGTLFVVGDTEETLKRSRCLILDPLRHHSDDLKWIDDANMRETVKELAQLDGAFIISSKGVVVSACRYIDAASDDINLPLGLGSRHMAAASITKETDAIAVVVSESSTIRIFDDGVIVSEVIPEVWLLKNYGLHLVNSAKRSIQSNEESTKSHSEQTEPEA